MRRALALALSILSFCAALAAAPRSARAAEIGSIVLHADRVAFYSNRFIVTGDGNVRVSLSDGTIITGRTFAMDLKLNRFLIAGAVTLTSGSYHYEGAAFSEFLDYRRAYFLPLLDEPDRWTFVNENYIPARGREMPGDAFVLPDVAKDHPFILSQEARITPRTGVGFSPARIYTFGAYTPTPEYYENFSQNSNFAQNSLAGATADLGYPFWGTKNSTTAIHLRYDDINKTYLGIEQHLVGKNDYAVFSINPLTRPQKQYNFLGSIKSNDQHFQFTTFDQVSAFQHGFTQPYSSSAYENAQITYSLKNSFVQITGNQYQNSLLAEPQPDANGALWYGDTGHPWVPNHPGNAQLAWVGTDHPLNKMPIHYRLRTGIQVAHDGYGLGAYNGTEYTTQWQTFAGFTLWSDPIKLTSKNVPSDRAVNFQITYDRQRTFVQSQARYQDSANTTATLSRQFNRKVSAYVSYIIQNQGDYLGSLQPVFYPSSVVQNPYDGKTYPGWAAFDGFVTLRDVQLAYNFTPTPYFTITLQGDHRQDFPAPIPYFYGNAPNSVTARTTFRLNTQLSVTIQRSYFFNFANQGWSPTFGIQVGP